MNKNHRVTHTSEHTRRVWDVTSMRRSTIVERNEKYYPLRHKLTPPDTKPTDTATTRLAPIHLRVARMVLWVFILTCESSPTATHSAVNERSVPLFCSVAVIYINKKKQWTKDRTLRNSICDFLPSRRNIPICIKFVNKYFLLSSSKIRWYKS